MSLILDLALEHADIDTLLDCLFLNKHVHGVVMRILSVEFKLIRDFSNTLKGDIYQGIKYMWRHFDLKYINYYRRHEKRIKYFKTVQNNCSKRSCNKICPRMEAIYVRLYPFNINIHAYYIQDISRIEMITLVYDFRTYIEKYHYKVHKDLMGVLILYAQRINYIDEFIGTILRKGFAIDQILKVGGRKLTILHFCLLFDWYDMVNMILDKNPNLFIHDSEGLTAYKLFRRKNFDDTDERFVKLEKKFYALADKQTANMVEWI